MTSNWGRETITIFEIRQRHCSLTYGSAPCTAVLGTDGDHKCFNTPSSCQDTPNYTEEILTLRFARPHDELSRYYENIIPSLDEGEDSISTTPAKVNLGGMERSSAPFGERESVSVRFRDHQHSDNLVDKYRLARASGAAQADAVGYDPFERGTFWGKWLARNRFYPSYECAVREGYLGDALADMRVRNYVIDSISGPDDGRVSLVAKDLFSRLEKKKAVVPKASLGRLNAAITKVALSATLAPAGIGNLGYPASGKARMGDEVVSFTRAGDVLTLTREQLNTVANAHAADDLVQLVKEVVSSPAADVVYDFITNYSSIAATAIDKARWDADAAAGGMTQLYTAYITEPTPVADLIGELEEQAGFTLWPDVTTGRIEFSPLAAHAPAFVADDAAWIVDGSLTKKYRTDKRVSQTWVLFNQFDPTKSLSEETNYRSHFVSADAAGVDNYGSEAIRKILSRWIPLGGRATAQNAADRIMDQYSSPPLEARFTAHADREDAVALTRHFTLHTSEVQDETGAQADTTMAIVSIERAADRIELETQQVRLSPVNPAAPRVIPIDSNTLNLDLRAIHDSLYAAPTGTETIVFVIEAGVVVGSSSSGSPAVRTGLWGSVVPTITIRGRIQAKGGTGGQGATGLLGGSDGATGGTALLVEDSVNIDNTTGEIWGGGGGGGGGGTGGSLSSIGGGGGGGGGAGSNGGNPGPGGPGFNANDGSAGQTGSDAAGGAGGAPGAGDAPSSAFGGQGGDPGQAGLAGGSSNSAGGSPGAGGKYIDGIANVTWTGGTGDLRGAVS